MVLRNTVLRKARARWLVQHLEPRRLLANGFDVDAGGPYTIWERASLTLSSSASRAATKWEWDLNYNAAAGFQPDVATQYHQLDGDLLDGPSTFTVAVRAVDDRGRTDIDTALVTVHNDTPYAFLHTSIAGYPGEPITISMDHPDDSQPDIAAGLLYAFDLDNNGTFETDTGTSNSTLAPDWMIRTPGRYDIRGRISDKDGASSIETFYALVNAPYVSLSDRTVAEGSQITLHVGYSRAGTPLSYEWDLDYDGVTFEPSATGASAPFDASGHDGPRVITMAVRATDAYGNRSIASATLTVTNVAPTIYVSLPQSVREGGAANLYSEAYDAPADRSTLVRQFDFGNDGTIDATLDRGYGAYVTIPAQFLEDGPGSLAIRSIVTDDDGASTEVIHNLPISNAAPTVSLVVDPTDVGVATVARVTGAFDSSPLDLPTLRFSYDLNYDGVYEIANTADTSVAIPAGLTQTVGTRNVRVKVTDKDGGFGFAVATLSVGPGTTATITEGSQVNNVHEGQQFLLHGTSTRSVHASSAAVDWDLDYDGTTFTSDQTGTIGTFLAPDGPAQRTVAFRVVDSRGVSAIDTILINVVNLAPLATVVGPGTVLEGATGALVRLDNARDASAADAAALRFSFDFDNDGAFDIVDATSPEGTIPAALTADGPSSFTVRARVSDDDGGSSDYLVPVSVTNVVPTVTLSAPATVKVGETYTLTVDVSDVGPDTVSSIVVDWRDGTTTTLAPGTNSATKVYTGSQGTRSIDVKVTDEDGVHVARRSVVVDAPPAISRFTFIIDVQQTSATTPRGPRLSVITSESIGTSLTFDDLVLTNLTTGEIIPPSTAIFSGTSPFAEARGWTFPTGLPDGNYRAVIPAGAITDSTGNVSSQESSVEFFTLAGDANRDRVVDFSDLVILARNYNQLYRSFTLGNFNFSTDGMVDFNDLVILAQQYNKSLPAIVPPPLAVQAAAVIASPTKRKPVAADVL